MMISCPQCKKQLEIEEGLAGQQVQCSVCLKSFTAPRSPHESPARATALETPGEPAPPDPAGPSGSKSLDFNSARFRVGSKLLLAFGLILVILGRGCDSIGNRGVYRAKAKAQKVKAEFEEKWDRKQAKLDRSSSDYFKRSRELVKEKEKAKAELKKGEWLGLDADVRYASATNAMRGYWRECVFVLGTVFLALGALAVGFWGKGAERLICPVLIVIITFSLYVGGVAWISSIMNTAKGGVGL